MFADTSLIGIRINKPFRTTRNNKSYFLASLDLAILGLEVLIEIVVLVGGLPLG